MNLKPFDLKLAQEGHPIQTRDGRLVKFIAYVPEAGKFYRVLVLRENEECPAVYAENGKIGALPFSQSDLFMAPMKQERWINIYDNGSVGAHASSQEKAKECRAHGCIACIKISYTEGEGL